MAFSGFSDNFRLLSRILSPTLYNEIFYLLKDVFRSKDQDPLIGLICNETQPLPTVGQNIELAAIPTFLITRLAPESEIAVHFLNDLFDR